MIMATNQPALGASSSSSTSSPSTTESKPLHIAIIGAGIGGLALSIGLLRHNIPFTLYESASAYSTVGAGVGLGPNALRAMDLLDPRLRGLYDEISTGNVTPGKNHVMMDAMYTEEGFGEKRGWKGKPFGAECYERTSAHRKALLDIMTSLIPSENVKFDKRLKSMKQCGSRVVLAFEDGEVVEASAAVGCDGAKGATRRFVLGEKYPQHVEATYSGKYVYRSIVPMEDAVKILGDHAGDAKMFMGKGVNITTFPISNGKQCNVVAFKMDDKPWPHKEWTKAVSRDEMIADFAEAGVDQRLIRLLDWAKPLKWSIWHHTGTPTYHSGLTVLLGDSAHATTPHQAAGAGQCFEDALVLSQLLALIPSHHSSSPNPNPPSNAKSDPSQLLETAFKVFDEIRRPRANKVVDTSQETGMMMRLTHPETGEDMDEIVRRLNERLLWIWEHDLEDEGRRAQERFLGLVEAGVS
ncbi:FAD/NAD(P)-binding domain-containing protein [Aulographum hederae CBS 113979]|uniref:FAD/NAD(P)-binding domain-containing protein n=1 Tax=Aulographum hederae CBS 113979 TaxID=1176131 RepID=A0A6G1GPC8_9PEZI|nr:FAD/NAD(P)-binding domain-containing protein [Aulographum hederae CBS 113979]